ncbi:MAG: WG repeat-containing protein [Bryobacterales bacterium]|nr:WG repeat-containing protein [Bryobacterales bacterium]
MTGRRYDSAQEYSEGLAGVRVGDLWGYVDHAGKWVIPARFTAAARFSDGMARVTEGGRTFFVANDGTTRVIPEGKWFSDFSEGRAVASSYDGRQYHRWFIDKTGNRAFPGTFAHATDFKHGLAHVAIRNGPRGEGNFAWIDANGKTVFAYSVP